MIVELCRVEASYRRLTQPISMTVELCRREDHATACRIQTVVW